MAGSYIFKLFDEVRRTFTLREVGGDDSGTLKRGRMLKVESEIVQILSPETVTVGLPGTSKQEVIDALVDLITNDSAVVDIEQVRHDVWERERIMSTGVGQGLALPHAETAGVTRKLAALAVTSQPIDFGSIDDEPVRLMFLLIYPEGARSQHIKILSRISRLMNRKDARQAMMDAGSDRALLEALERAEQDLLDR